MEFILYDIILNVFRVDEAYEAHAKIQDRFILLSTPGNQFRNLNNDKALFDFYRDDLYKNHSSEKVNTRFRVFNNNAPERFNDYYAHLSYLNYLKLCYRFKKLWFQKADNIMWLVNLFVALIAIVSSVIVTLKFSQTNNQETNEIKNEIKIDDQQLNEIITALKTNNTIRLDSIQIREIIQQLKKVQKKKNYH